MADASAPRSRRKKSVAAPTTPDAIEIAMGAEASGDAPVGPAHDVLVKQGRLLDEQLRHLKLQGFSERIGAGLKIMGGVAGLCRKDQTVEKPAPVPRPFQEQPVLGGGQPDLSQMVGQTTGGHGLALAPDCPTTGTGLVGTGAQTHWITVLFHHDGYGPGTAQGLTRLPSSQFLLGGIAQATTGGEEADGLQKIGLARPVGPDKKNGPTRQGQLRAGVGPEVGQGQMGDGRAHGRLLAAFARPT